jgi:hypothetical protein
VHHETSPPRDVARPGGLAQIPSSRLPTVLTLDDIEGTASEFEIKVLTYAGLPSFYYTTREKSIAALSAGDLTVEKPRRI